MSKSCPVEILPGDEERTKRYVLDRVVVDSNGCWIWQRNKLHAGHGQAKYKGYPVKAHRLSYAAFVEDPGALVVCHRCDVPACVNPAHLFVGTKGDNNRDAYKKGRYELRAHAKLTHKKADMVRLLWRLGWKQTDIAEVFGTKRHVIWAAVNGKSWRAA